MNIGLADYPYLSAIVLLVLSVAMIYGYGQWRANRAVALERRKYETLLANLPGVTYRSRGDQQASLMHIDDAIVDLVGVPAETLCNGQRRSLLEFMHPDDQERLRSDYLDSIRDFHAYRIT